MTTSSAPFNKDEKILAELSFGEDIARGKTYTCDDCWYSRGVWYVTLIEVPSATWRADRFVKKESS